VGTVQAQAIMSLDGYVAKQDNTIGRLFDWLQNGEIAVPTPAGDFTVHLTPPSSEHWRRWVSSLGALVCGRTLFVLPGRVTPAGSGLPGDEPLGLLPGSGTAAQVQQPLFKLGPGPAPLRERAEDLLQHRKLLIEGGQLGFQRRDAAPLRGDAVGDRGHLRS
jgi:hypothetical protein